MNVAVAALAPTAYKYSQVAALLLSSMLNKIFGLPELFKSSVSKLKLSLCTMCEGCCHWQHGIFASQCAIHTKLSDISLLTGNEYRATAAGQVGTTQNPSYILW